MSERKKILHIQTGGTESSERAYTPSIPATVASIMNIDATAYYLIKCIISLMKCEAEKVKVGGFPTLKKIIDNAIKTRVKLSVCEQTCQLPEIASGDFVSEDKIFDAATLNDLALNLNSILCFKLEND